MPMRAICPPPPTTSISWAAVLKPSHFNQAAAAPGSPSLLPILETFLTFAIHIHSSSTHEPWDSQQHSKMEHRSNDSFKIMYIIYSFFKLIMDFETQFRYDEALELGFNFLKDLSYLKHDVSDTGLCLLLQVETNPYWCYYSCPETEINPFYWVHLNRFHLKTKAESSLRNVEITLTWRARSGDVMSVLWGTDKPTELSLTLNKRQDDGQCLELW
jgi:hypothetical protein